MRRRVLAALLFVALLAAGYGVRAGMSTQWTYTGGDSFIYMGLANELVEHGRYAARLPPWVPDRPKDPPLSYARPPGYPLLLAAVAPPGGAYTAYYPPVKRVQRALDLLTCALIFLMAWQLGGAAAAWPAFGLALVHPVLLLYAGSIMSETLATLLSAAALVLLLRPQRGLLALAAAGGVIALGTLVRADGVLLLPVALLAALLSPSRLRGVGVVVLGFALVFAPWPLRNLRRFGAAHPLGALCDTRGQPIPRTGFLRWYSTWLVSEEQLPTTLWCALRPECRPNLAAYPPEAFRTAVERVEVERLFGLRASEGYSARVDAGFRRLTWERTTAEPLRTLGVAPLRRALHLMLRGDDLPIRSVGSPWPVPRQRVGPLLSLLNGVVVVLALGGLWGLWRRGRALGLLCAAALALRLGFLSVGGFVEARYMVELLPLLLVLCGVCYTALRSAHAHRNQRQRS